MASNFVPPSELDIYCRFCKKVMPAILERSIADNGRIIKEDSTFEYSCTKCHRTHCYKGSDIDNLFVADTDEVNVETETVVKEYSINEHYHIGDKISHSSHDEEGTVVGKEPGSPTKINVLFGKKITTLVEDIQ